MVHWNKSLSVQLLGENNIILGIGDILLNFLWFLIFLFTVFDNFSLCRTINYTQFPICVNIEPICTEYITRVFKSNSVTKDFGSEIAEELSSCSGSDRPNA